MMKNKKRHTPPRNLDPSLDAITLPSVQPRILHRIASQSLLITLLMVIVPSLFAFKSSLNALYFSQPAGISLLFSCASVLMCSFALNNLKNFPGVTQFHYILPVILSCYAITIFVILTLRLNYSIFVLGLSFMMTVISHLTLFHLRERNAPKFHYYVVDGGRTNEIPLPPHINVVRIEKPRIPTEPGAIIVADLHHDHDPEWLRVFAKAALLEIPVYHVTEIIETITGRVQIDHISENHFGSLLIVGTYTSVKRMADIVTAAVVLIVCAPLLGATALLIKLDSPGPAIFRQQRVGLRGSIFNVLKFRTMKVQESVADERVAAMTQQDDQRITKLGRTLRRLRIDELPQLVNVLRGEMSLIGPRPEALALSRWYLNELPFYEYRHIVRPGITGWAQVSQGHVADLMDVREKLYYDFFYIKNFSYWIDILITLRTIKTILTGYGSR